ncbi:MAG: flagellar hook-associated family protein [Aliihoeflea sp.]
MKAMSVSSNAISQALRLQMARTQAEMIKAEKEVVTGQVADRGLHLGVRTGQSVSLDRDIARLENIKGTNGIVMSRLDATQNALGETRKVAEQMMGTLATMLNGALDPAVPRTQARTVIETMNAVINSTVNGDYIFAGTNTDVRPLADFSDPASTARASFEALATASFPGPGPIDGAQMAAFLGGLETQMLGAGWQADWSGATDATIQSRIALGETAQTSVSANEEGLRKLAMASAMILGLVDRDMDADAKRVMTEKAIELTSSAISDVTAVQSEVGLVQGRVTQATDRVSLQVDLFKRTQIDMVGVDEFEAGTRLTSLLTQIETSYTLTARIQQLSLLKFIS